jgi:hypothetical protein
MHHWVSFALKDPLCVGSVYRIRECADENPVIPLDTIKAFPGATVTYKLFGGKHERHYGHYDLLCSRTAKREVFPIVENFLEKCDGSKSRFVN